MRVVGLGLVFLAGFAVANDHNNIDPGRPLRFEDASTIAFGERAFEFGLSGRKRSRLGAELEFKYGFALNQEIGIGFARGFDGGSHVDLSYLNAFRREIGDLPAVALRLGVASNDEEAEGQVRLIASKTMGLSDKVHLNFDFYPATGRPPAYGVMLGYSKPLGYPRRFDQTFVAELSYRYEGKGWEGALGIGLRQQLDPQTTFDLGLEAGFSGETILRAGFARSF